MTLPLLGAGPSAPDAGLVVDDFFVDAVSGDDGNDGLSSGSAWQTISKVNSASIGTGSTVSFNRGDTFSGSLTLKSGITYGAYGTGNQPIIASTTSAGAVGQNVEDMELSDLHFVGSGGNATHGVYIYNDQAGDTKLAGINIHDCEVEGYGRNGINVEGENDEAGFDTPLVTDNIVHDCTGNWASEIGSAGIHVHAAGASGCYKTGLAHADPQVTGNTVYDCPGTAGTTNWTGSGIMLGQCDDFLLEGNEAYGNGGSCNATAGGPIGIWSADCIGGLAQSNVSHDNLTGNLDGGGFGIDGGSQDAIYEHNIAYGNAGPGMLVYAYADTGIRPFTGNVVRYNILTDNGLGTAYGNLHVQNDDDQGAATFQDIRIYNNTIVADDATEVAVKIAGSELSGKDATFANNLFVSANAAPLIEAVANPFIFTNNGYYATGTFEIDWGGSSYSSVALWKATETAQEVLYALATELLQNPALDTPGGTSISNYALGAGSNAIGIGLDVVSQYGWTVPATDAAGVAIRTGGFFDLGAVQGTLPTNLFTAPDDVSNAAWDKFQLQSPTTANGMDGGANAQQVLANAVTDYAGFGQQDVAFASTQPTLRLSSFVKPVDFSGLFLYTFIANGDSSIYAEEWVDLLAATAGSQNAAGAITNRGARRQARPNGFFLVVLEGDFTANVTAAGGGLAYTEASDTYVATFGGTEGIDHDGHHLFEVAI